MALSVGEKRAVIRRMSERMMGPRDSIWTCAAGKISADELAERMHTSTRSVQRMKETLPPAHKRRCPICRRDMWVLEDNTIEAHPTATYDQCSLSGQTWQLLPANQIPRRWGA